MSPQCAVFETVLFVLYAVPTHFTFILFVHPLQSEFYLLKQFCGPSDADCLEALEYTSGETCAC